MILVTKDGRKGTWIRTDELGQALLAAGLPGFAYRNLEIDQKENWYAPEPIALLANELTYRYEDGFEDIVAAIKWAWESLGPTELTVLQALSVSPQAFANNIWGQWKERT